MSGLTDAAITRLRRLGSWPEFESGRYTIVEEIGRGGMGTVYLAVDEELGREVAIKIPNALANTALERRLLVEARALARLEHPGIVPIHDAGRLADGRLFYVMKRVQGRTLSAHLHGIPDLNDRLRIFERICEPVSFAHAQGFVHRDLKPENVMIGAFGEVVVMDWGVVKVGTDEHSDRGTVVGTRGFMAPEQARGAADDVDRRADVFSLGAILFFLLTGEAPALDADSGAKLRGQGTPRPLAAICVRAMAVDPATRYQTVAALADDIARYRSGRAVDAYRETTLERLARFGRTHRVAILLLLAYVIMRALVAFVAGR